VNLKFFKGERSMLGKMMETREKTIKCPIPPFGKGLYIRQNERALSLKTILWFVAGLNFYDGWGMLFIMLNGIR
jgi:hypothetical protein